ncbi:phosphoadenosine phosphosulfate reductase [Rhodobacter sp. Har01]|uniref:phosphoadenosine phosphosulfate reductase n=1 Tax=Rhodobacter sp. Har01 TaxID=2883999 RepID=UPI001D06D2F4|nr:phosphoadenosine phosphosulfate reductase [Rhodobacter sp. Har01]MCB6176839.1 phosphoadenosine phosphosulfate reductase [Rhodobacter sp. Har01]
MSELAEPMARSDQDWMSAMDLVAEDDGYLERLGKRHWAFFAEQGTTLLVTFERAEAVRARDSRMPAQYDLARAQRWSILTVLAEGETFWRDPAVWGYFDRLVDDAFFDDFDRVVFYGAGPAGYAAAAYMVAAPGARALLIAPRATMDPAIAGWDRRHRAARRLDFTRRYGYAPDMTGGADRVWLVHDPLHGPDAAHAALFRRPWLTVLNARRTGEATEAVLAATGVLDRALVAATEGRLTPAGFARLWRTRRSNPAYLRAILTEAVARKRPWMETLICRSVTRRMNAPRLQARLAGLTGGKG